MSTAVRSRFIKACTAAVIAASVAGAFSMGCLSRTTVTCIPRDAGCEYDGQVLFGLKEYAAALDVWESCLACDPGNPRLLNLAGTASCMQGDYDEAISMFSRALAGNGGRAGIVNNMGYAYICKGDYRRAELCFRMALLHDEFHTLAAGNLSTVRKIRNGGIREQAYRRFRHTNAGQQTDL